MRATASMETAGASPRPTDTKDIEQTKEFSATFFVHPRTVEGSDGSATKWEERLERVAAVSRGRGGLPTKANAGYRNRTAGPYGKGETKKVFHKGVGVLFLKSPPFWEVFAELFSKSDLPFFKSLPQFLVPLFPKSGRGVGETPQTKHKKRSIHEGCFFFCFKDYSSFLF